MSQSASDEQNAGFAAHAATGTEDDDDPLTVHGIALGEGVASGLNESGEDSYYPPEVLEDAADKLVGRKIVDDSEHDDLEATQPPNSAIVGEVTDARYKPGVGVAFEGEVDREPERSLVENGRMVVSPALFRETGDIRDGEDAREVERIAHWRDLAIVSDGGSDAASIQPGAAPAAAQEALQAEALAAVFDADAHASVSDGTKSDGGEASVETMASDNEEKNQPPEGEQPPEDGEGEEQKGELQSKSKEELISLVEDLREEKAQRKEKVAEMKGQLKALGGDVESMESALESFDGSMAETLADRTGMSEEFIGENMGHDEMIHALDDLGTDPVETLTPAPQTGDPDPTQTEGGSGSGGTVEALSAGEQEKVRQLAADAKMIESADDHETAEALRSDAADLVGVDDFDDVDVEVI